MLVGFLHNGGIAQWSYAIASDIAAQGLTFFKFTSDDVDFKSRTILGEFWEDGTWIKKRTLFPVAIKNFELNKGKDKILDTIPYSLGQIVRKDDQMGLFSTKPAIAKYIPKSLNVDDNCPIIDKIKEWGAGLLKPARGRLGQGIIFLKSKGSNFEINDNGDIKTVNEDELRKFLEPFYKEDARDYILQQFAAGTGPKDRYFNIRAVVIKSGDGDWHACNFLMSLLARPNSIIANRDMGANNIDLDSWLKHYYGSDVDKIYNEFFLAAVNITRILDDSKDNTAEEIALDMAIDNSGHIWLHEANWRGGMWLFEDDIGLYRHSGANLKRIARQSRAGNDLDRADAIKIAINARKQMHNYAKNDKNCTLNDGVLFGIELNRASDSTASLVAEAITYALPLLSISSATSFYKAQRRARYGIEAIKEQSYKAILPFIISKGGSCVYDPKDGRSYQTWLQEELFKSEYIDAKDLECGYSVSDYFLNRTIKENCKDLNLTSLDLFIIEGLEHSLANRIDWEEKWKAAAAEMYRCTKNSLIKEWGFSLNTSTINKNRYTNAKYLLSLIDSDLIAPTYLHVSIDYDYNFDNIEILLKELKKLKLKVIFSLPTKKVIKKEWNEPYSNVQKELINRFKKSSFYGSIVLCPVSNRDDLKETFSLIGNGLHVNLYDGNKWLYNRKKQPKFLGAFLMRNITKQNADEKLKFKKRMQALALFAKFDRRQYFRFFVDGRFHEKYRGWSGYEANEQGSVSGILQAYCYFLDNFDLSEGLKPSYIRSLHALCMKNVLTKNPKSMPGDMRYLEAGFNIFAHYSTIDSIQELIDRHIEDATPLFHTRGFEKSSDNFTAEEIYEALKEKKKLKFRPWYPILTNKQKEALTNEGDLEKFYEVKHFIQHGFAVRIDKIVHEYNSEIEKASSDEESLIAISRVVRNLEMLHPFPDGNGRTFVAVLMNHLLLYNGFLPAILFDPNIDIELSVKEFAQEIKKGIANTELLLHNPEAVLYNYSIVESSQKEIQEFEVLAKDLTKRLSPYADLNFDNSDIMPHEYKAKYLYLTPERLSEVTKGVWMNANQHTISHLRFEHVEIDEVNSRNQLFFFRNLAEFKSNDEDPLKYIDKLAKNGVVAVVVDDIDIARESSLPALHVKDIDDALADAARAARGEVNCKAIAVIGSTGKTTTKSTIAQILNNQAQVHAMNLKGNKTPHIMTSLSNLRLTDNLEVNEIAIDNRPNPARFRARAVSPDVVLVTNLIFDDKSAKESITAYAAIANGIKDGGVYIINSDFKYLNEMLDAITEVKDVSIQTYGVLEGDIAKIIDTTFDKKKNLWNIKASILGEVISYKIKGDEQYLPVSSVGILLSLANLGYDIYEAAKEFS